MRGGVNNAEVAQTKLKEIYKATLDPTSNTIKAGHGYMGVYTGENGTFHTAKWMTHRLERGFSNRWNMMRMKPGQGDAAFLASEMLAQELHDLAVELRPDAVNEVDQLLQNYMNRPRNQYDGRSLLSRAVVYQVVHTIDDNIEITQEEKDGLLNADNTRVNAMSADDAARIILSKFDVIGKMRNDDPHMFVDLGLRDVLQSENRETAQKGIRAAAKAVIEHLVRAGLSRQSLNPLDEEYKNIVFDALRVANQNPDTFVGNLTDLQMHYLAEQLLKAVHDYRLEPAVHMEGPQDPQLQQVPVTVEEYEAARTFLNEQGVKPEEYVSGYSAFGAKYSYDALLQRLDAGLLDENSLPDIVSLNVRAGTSQEIVNSIVTVMKFEAHRPNQSRDVVTIPGRLIDGVVQPWYVTRRDLQRMTRLGQLTPYGIMIAAFYVCRTKGWRLQDDCIAALVSWARRNKWKSPATAFADLKRIPLFVNSDTGEPIGTKVYDMFDIVKGLYERNDDPDYPPRQIDGNDDDTSRFAKEFSEGGKSVGEILNEMANEQEAQEAQEAGDVGGVELLKRNLEALGNVATDDLLNMLRNYNTDGDVVLDKYVGKLVKVLEYAKNLPIQNRGLDVARWGGGEPAEVPEE